MERHARAGRTRLLLPEGGAVHVAARSDAGQSGPHTGAALLRRVPAPKRNRRQPADALVRVRQPPARDVTRTLSLTGARSDGGLASTGACAVRAARTPGAGAPAVNHERAKRQTADHGRLPCAPSDSGSIANIRSASGRRPSFAAVLRSERTSIGCQPCAVKNGGPSAGANRNGAPAALTALPTDCFIISTNPGDARSSAQC